jgi:hypothetical protein
MSVPLNQPQTSIVDLPEENRELSTDELPLIVGGYTSVGGGGSASWETGREADAIRDN